MVRVTRRYRFHSSHRLHSPSLSEAQNESTYGKCNNPYGHGHNYVLEVTVRGDVDPQSGQAVPLAQMDRLVQDSVLRVYDHRHMNADIAEFSGAWVPTTENVAVDVLRRLQQAWTGTFPQGTPVLDQVRIHETKNNIFTVAAHE